ncbi:MAG TPA: hypothetical protein PKU78_03405 [Candidatus Dojkabacteria bacterium]|nr:hypothetical protein [Candidatus Dojkabacteria bacterium]HRO65242.1 hypothetical protein [Candidatus Dojkabacteria bacterium]HRP50792.1 hypothetical protein [Candidatus Dojkabacteria bacterium]
MPYIKSTNFGFNGDDDYPKLTKAGTVVSVLMVLLTVSFLLWITIAYS